MDPEEIVKAQVVNRYQELQSILQQHTKPNQPNQPFEEQKQALLKTLKNVPLNQLTKDQLNFLTELGIAESVGNEGAEIVEDLLYRNVIDVATSATKLQEIIGDINKGIQQASQIRGGLTGCVPEEDYESDNEVLVRVSFTGNASMSNLSDFKSWGGTWYDIGRGIAMAHGATPEDIKVVGATKGSIVIELAVLASIATTTSGIILAGLKVAEKVLDIRKKAEEIKSLKLKNMKLAKDIEKEAENEKKHGIEQISQDIIKSLGIGENDDGDKVTALNKSVKNLVEFIENGGEVDFILPNDEPEDDTAGTNMKERKQLRATFQKIRQLEHKMALLEYKDPQPER